MQKGFTLVELLVTMAIIGLLATIVMLIVEPIRQQSRDIRRMSDFQIITTALEKYYDTNGSYPPVDIAESDVGERWPNLLGIALSPYVSPLPEDPLNKGGYGYFYDSDSGDNYQSYGLMIYFESAPYRQTVDDDGGSHSSVVKGSGYEGGQQPAYCMQKYGTEWYTFGNLVCQKGN